MNFLTFKGFVKCGNLEGSCPKTKIRGREEEKEGGREKEEKRLPLGFKKNDAGLLLKLLIFIKMGC